MKLFNQPIVLPTEFVLTENGRKHVSRLKAGDVLLGIVEEKDMGVAPSLDELFYRRIAEWRLKSMFDDEQMRANELSPSKSVFDTLNEVFKQFEDSIEEMDAEEEGEALGCLCGRCSPKEQVAEELEAIKRKPVHVRRIDNETIIVELWNGASLNDIAEFMYNAKEKYGYHISGQHGSGIVMSTNARSVTCMTKDDFKELITIFGVK